MQTGDKEIHTFPMGLSPKMNVITLLGFKLVYYDAAVQYVSHYATETSLDRVGIL